MFNRTGASLSDLEVPLSSLCLDQEFATSNPLTDELTWGRLLYIGTGSALVEIIEDGKLVQVRWSLDVPVIPDSTSTELQGDDMSTPLTSEVQAMHGRWKFQLSQLAGADATKQAAAAERIPKLITEAGAKNIPLTPPWNLFAELEGHPLFEGVTFDVPPEAANGAATPPPADAAPTTKATKAAAKAAARANAVAEAKAGSATAAGKTPRGPAKPKVGVCIVTGKPTKGGNFFPGQDAVAKKLIMQVERGEIEMIALPEGLQKATEFKKGELHVEKDDKGKKISELQLYVCVKSPVKLPNR